MSHNVTTGGLVLRHTDRQFGSFNACAGIVCARVSRAECPFNCRHCVNSDDGSIMICKTCKHYYVLNTGDCGSCPQYCSKCSESSDGLSCTQCHNRTVMVADGSCQRQSPFQFQLLEFIVPDGSTVFLKHSLHKITAEYKQMYKKTHTHKTIRTLQD